MRVCKSQVFLLQLSTSSFLCALYRPTNVCQTICVLTNCVRSWKYISSEKYTADIWTYLFNNYYKGIKSQHSILQYGGYTPRKLNHLENLQRYYEIMACPMGAMFIERKSNGPLNHKIKGNTMYYMISCKFSEFPFELCRKRAFNRAKKALFWSRAKILPSGYHAQLDSCAGPFLGVVQK